MHKDVNYWVFIWYFEMFSHSVSRLVSKLQYFCLNIHSAGVSNPMWPCPAKMSIFIEKKLSWIFAIVWKTYKRSTIIFGCWWGTRKWSLDDKKAEKRNRMEKGGLEVKGSIRFKWLSSLSRSHHYSGEQAKPLKRSICTESVVSCEIFCLVTLHERTLCLPMYLKHHGTSTY